MSIRNLERRLDDLEADDTEDLTLSKLLSADPSAAHKTLHPDIRRKLESGTTEASDGP